MPTHTMMVFSNPTAGHETEYNRWYGEQHVHDVMKVPGVVGARRYKLADGQGNQPHRYMAIYDLETNDAQAVMAEIRNRAGTPAMPMSDALDTATVALTFWEALG